MQGHINIHFAVAQSYIDVPYRSVSRSRLVALAAFFNLCFLIETRECRLETAEGDSTSTPILGTPRAFSAKLKIRPYVGVRAPAGGPIKFVASMAELARGKTPPHFRHIYVINTCNEYSKRRKSMLAPHAARSPSGAQAVHAECRIALRPERGTCRATLSQLNLQLRLHLHRLKREQSTRICDPGPGPLLGGP